jgi:hypothetical protein
MCQLMLKDKVMHGHVLLRGQQRMALVVLRSAVHYA